MTIQVYKKNDNTSNNIDEEVEDFGPHFNLIRKASGNKLILFIGFYNKKKRNSIRHV